MLYKLKSRSVWHSVLFFSVISIFFLPSDSQSLGFLFLYFTLYPCFLWPYLFCFFPRIKHNGEHTMVFNESPAQTYSLNFYTVFSIVSLTFSLSCPVGTSIIQPNRNFDFFLYPHDYCFLNLPHLRKWHYHLPSAQLSLLVYSPPAFKSSISPTGPTSWIYDVPLLPMLSPKFKLLLSHGWYPVVPKNLLLSSEFA